MDRPVKQKICHGSSCGLRGSNCENRCSDYEKKIKGESYNKGLDESNAYWEERERKILENVEKLIHHVTYNWDYICPADMGMGDLSKDEAGNCSIGDCIECMLDAIKEKVGNDG